MNSAPAEVNFKIFGYLPRIDLRRFQQINSSVRQIATNLLKDSKPLFVMSIGDVDKDYYFILLKTNTCSIELMFDGTGRLKSSSQSEIFLGLKEDFEVFVEHHPDAPQPKDVFLTWLFSKIDLQILTIETGGRYEEVAKDILAALRIQPFRCPLIISFHDISPTLGFGANSTFIKEFCELQRQQGVDVYLQINPPALCVERVNDVDILNSYTDFVYVQVVYDHTGIFPSMVAIALRWHQGKQPGHAELKEANFRIRFTYYSRFDHTAVTLANNFLKMHQTVFALEGITEEKIRCMESFETKCIPDEVVCRHLDDGSALEFKFFKTEEHADMYIQISN